MNSPKNHTHGIAQTRNAILTELIIAVSTQSHAGLEDVVSPVFGKAKTFTVVYVKDGKVKNVRVIDNPAASFKYGAGPVAVKTLADLKVNLIISDLLGPGAISVLEHYKMDHYSAEPGKKVSDVIKEVLSAMKIAPS
jgi:predicted Fe-Mo cluster-binding NifX family protein